MPGESHPFEAVVKTDATHLPVGQYRGRIHAVCLDCSRERRCTQAQLEWPINLTVKPPRKQIPFKVRELEESTLTKDVDQPGPAPDEDVLSVLNWTNNVIVPTQPTYSARNLIPHFKLPEERSRNFIVAREKSILEK
ncbi:MAG: hypothetical protein M3362_19620, partial [Acidobacteriota bacterium]|nr:hypothetical protein [Acidobacteriota bacterium]